MKQNSLQRFFATLMFLAITTITWAYDFSVDGIYYSINSDGTSVSVTYKTTSDRGYSDSVVIPATVTYDSKEYSVRSIGDRAFYFCSGLTSVTIPNSVTSIGEDAFYHCSGLTSITIPNSVTSIAGGVFSDCSSLTSVTIPDSVTSIGDGAFYHCSGLTSITIPNSVTSIAGGVFSDCSSLTSVTIPDSVTSIGDGAFYGCSSLSSVTIGNSVTSIGYMAFYGTAWYNNQPDGLVYAGKVAYKYKGTMPGGTHIILNEGTLGIAYDAFSGCSGLTSITIPESVTSIEGFAFFRCSSLSSVILPVSVTSIGWYAFCDCTHLTSITSRALNVPSTGEKCFEGVPLSSAKLYVSGSSMELYKSASQWQDFSKILSLAYDVKQSDIYYSINTDGTSVSVTNSGSSKSYSGTIVIPTTVQYGSKQYNVTSIGGSAFYGCPDFTSVTIPSSVTSIGSNAFNGCSGLTIVTLNTNEIVSKTYTASSNLKTIFGSQVKEYILGDDVKSIGDYAFYGCSGLTSVNIPSSVTSIGTRAFSSCSAIESISVDESNPTYDSRNQCNAIIETSSNTLITGCKNTLIPESVTSIGNYSFEGCMGLESVNIPNSVTSIGVDAFYYTAWYDNQPDGLVYAGKVAYKYKGTMPTGTNISLKEGTLGIGSKAFYGCSGLTSISIPNSVTRIGNHAFSHCSSLSKIYCYAENVPSTESELIFNETPINSAKLYVPNGSLELYKVLSPWKDFEKVLPNNTTIYYIVDGEIYKQYKIEADTPITPEPIPTKEGYTFSGWSEIPGTMPANDVTVTGTFSVNNYTLTYLLNGEPYLTKTIAYGTPLELEPTLKREGYTFTGWSEIPETMPARDVIIRGAFYINGDVNTDNEVDVVDVVDIARFVVGTPAITFMEVLADINKDGTVNIGDAVVLVNDIVGNQNFARIQLDTNRYASNKMLTLTRRNGDLSLNLKNESYYAAFQFDLYVPEDIEVSRIMLNSERKNYHQLLYNKIEDGHYRIAVMSKVNNIFNGHDGELLNITLDEIPDNEISIRNILFFDSEGQSYQFDDMESTITTQIEELSSTISKEKWVIYDLRARKSEKLQRGVNIVNGKKILY